MIIGLQIVVLCIWISYLVLEGAYDAWMYYNMPESIKKKGKFHIPHSIALFKRIASAIILSSFLCFTRYVQPTMFGVSVGLVVSLMLMLPFFQTGAYMQFRRVTAKLGNTTIPLDAKNKPYWWFATPKKGSSSFPDKNPWLRTLYLVLGLTAYFLILNV